MEDFRKRVLEAFPSAAFQGLVSTHDECDEGIDLLRELPGKGWDEIPSAFVDFNSGSLPLLGPEALVAFLPAWLLRSMETLSGKSVLAEFTMYFLCPAHRDDNDEDRDRGVVRMRKLVPLFDPAQRAVIAEFLRAISAGADESWRSYAESGLKWWVDLPAR